MSWPYDFDTRGIRALPHRLRLRKLLARMRHYDFSAGNYADVGCGDGYVTAQVMRVTGAQRCDGLDYDTSLLGSGEKTFREISFLPFNLNRSLNGSVQYDFVTCFETLEHVIDLPIALGNLLHLTKPGGLLVLTVPIEIGFVGTTKFLAKTVLWRDRLTEAFPRRPGMHRDYLKALVLGHGISRFRRDGNSLGYWPGHWGFDYRELDRLLNEQGVRFRAGSFLMTRYFEVRP
jgi:2-polyprenyl-3-methyl-5-hydroxy-6-metoxy-1,4-benzoquinol methylase